MERISDGKIPPQALITSPDWFAPLNVSQQSSVQIGGTISALRAPGYSWKLQWAPGIEPCESDFRNVASGSGSAPRSVSRADFSLPHGPVRHRPEPGDQASGCAWYAGNVESRVSSTGAPTVK